MITILWVGLKIEIHEIHEIHQNLRNPVSTNRNLLPTTKSNSAGQKLNIEIQRNRRKPLTKEISPRVVRKIEIHEIHQNVTKSSVY